MPEPPPGRPRPPPPSSREEIISADESSRSEWKRSSHFSSAPAHFCFSTPFSHGPQCDVQKRLSALHVRMVRLSVWVVGIVYDLTLALLDGLVSPAAPFCIQSPPPVTVLPSHSCCLAVSLSLSLSHSRCYPDSRCSLSFTLSHARCPTH